jgi:hypothetical protein
MRHEPTLLKGLAGRFLSSLSLGLALAAGCGELPPEDAGGLEVDAITADNGLRSINGLKVHNGLDATSGLNLSNGLGTSAGLQSTTGLMTTADGRNTVAYLVRCALPAGRSVTKTDQYGAKYTFTGQIGLAPEWETSTCGQSCQMWVSACMLALVNTTGMHYPIWMVGNHSALGWGTNGSFPLQEGSFFGNIFASQPSAYYCGGRDLGTNPIPGRIGSAQTAPPYSDIYGTGGRCLPTCTPADIPHAGDGSKACSGWNQVITVWHQ